MYGWLEKRPELEESWPLPVPIRRDIPTRREEYVFVYDTVSGIIWHEPAEFSLLDVATGYEVYVHTLPWQLATLGILSITATDIDDRTFANFTNAPRIKYVKDNMTVMQFEDRSFDIVTCVSVIEHLSVEDRAKALSEMARVARSHIIITADNIDPLIYGNVLRGHGWDVGDERPHTGGLTKPRVSFVWATRENG